MSIIPPSLIKVYADQFGNAAFNDLDEDSLLTVAQELDYSLRELIQDSSKYMMHSKRTKLFVDDLNASLKDKNLPCLYGYDPMEQLNFRPVPNSDVFYVPGEEVSLIDILQEPLPKAPLPPSLTCHALAIDGIQPAIPENPTVADFANKGDAVKVASALNIDRKDLQEEAEVKPLVKHVLSKELLLFYDTLVKDLTSSDKPELRQAALKTLHEDAGLQQLLPYLLQFVSEGVIKNLRDPDTLLLLMRSVNALLKNPYLFMEPYLHQVMPPVLTCLLGKRQGPSDFEVREEAATVIAGVCTCFGSVYQNMVPRVVKTIVKTMHDFDKPLICHYGAVCAVACLGVNAIESMLMPVLPKYKETLGQVVESEEKERFVQILSKCEQLVLEQSKE